MDLEAVYDAEAEQGGLAQVIMPRYKRMLEAWQELVASQFPELTPDEFRLDDAATRRQLAEAAEHVVMIDRATRDAIREQLQRGQEKGYSSHQLAYGVPADGFRGIDGLFTVTWASRAETVARTELAHAQNRASLDRYAATGVVDAVELVENDDTDAPCADRNGTVVPLAEKPGLLHPNCRLAIIPVVNEAALEAALEPPAPEEEWGRFSTTEGAEAAAKGRYPNIDFDFHALDVDAVNPTLRQFAKLAEEWPQVVERLEYIGGYGRVAPSVRGGGFFGQDVNTWAHASRDGKRIGLNPKWYGSATRLNVSLNQAAAQRFHPTGCDTIESIMTHEFGHQVENWLRALPGNVAAHPVVNAAGDGLVHNTFRSWYDHHKAPRSLSGYAVTTKEEGWAEAFAAQYHAPAAVKRTAFVRKQAALLDALHPRNWLQPGEWRWHRDLPQEERSGAWERLQAWLERFR